MKQLFSVVCRCPKNATLSSWEVVRAGRCAADEEAHNLPNGLENIYVGSMSPAQLEHWDCDTREAYWKVVEVYYNWETEECS